jgi:hypothetical protein
MKALTRDLQPMNGVAPLYGADACQSALQPWVGLGLLYNQSPSGVRFLNKILFYRMGLLAPCTTPNSEGPGCLS